MKKFILLIFLFTFYSNTAFADGYYFKGCKLSNAVNGDYIINIDKNVIEVNLKSIDGQIQKFEDEIKSIKEKKIISQKIPSGKGNNIYYQYFLNSDSQSVTKLEYIKEGADDLIVFNLKTKRTSLCANVKVDWDKKKLDEKKASKEQEQILKAQEQIKKDQSLIAICEGDDNKKWTDCKGTFVSESGHKYSGQFKDGKILKGTSLYPGGAKYIGEFKDYFPHGYGTFVWANGEKYYGQWQNGKSNGNGTKLWKDGKKYMGSFKNDKPHGKGTLYYTDGKKYVGELINGKEHGQGTFTYPDGSVYIGKFLAGNTEGEGECYDVESKSIECANLGNTKIKKYDAKDTSNILIEAPKWVRLSQYESNSKKGKKTMDKLKSDFDNEASDICLNKNYNILEKKIEVLEIDETPAYGLEPKIKLGIKGVIECVK